MTMQQKVIKIGDGLGIILPKKLLSHLKASVGDTLVATHTSDGIKLALEGANLDHQMATAREVIAKRKQALAKLK
jgi:putative addiction module antidote